MDLSTIDLAKLGKLSNAELDEVLGALVEPLADARRENQILYYKPASEAAGKVHFSMAPVVGIGGGNRASKTETVLADITARATGIFPLWNPEVFARRFRGPINVRIVVESLKTTLFPTILPKLQWWKWSGIDKQGGARGHWGWIPKMCLRDGDWSKSWNASTLMLTTLCRDPDNWDNILGESTWQFNSYDQDPSDFASGSFHDVHHDEPPPQAIWRENEARVMDVAGRMWTAMTWPDDPAIITDWIHDELYERRDEPGIDWFELWTSENRNLDQEAIAAKAVGWSAATQAVRLKGQPIRFSNRIHPLFTDHTQAWCFGCGQVCITQHDHCVECGAEAAEFCHVKDFEIEPAWPAVFLLDPHPRKPHMFCWVSIDPSDDWWVIAEGEVDDDPAELWRVVKDIEEEFGINTAVRLMDPNMGASPASTKRGVTWQDEFYNAGLVLELADDSEVGRQRVNELLKPDKYTRQPRFHIHERCTTAIWQIKRYVWDDFRRADQKDIKQKPRPKYDDFPAMFRYCANSEPDFRFLREGGKVIKRPGTRRR